MLAIVTAAVPKTVLFKIFSGLASGLSDAQLEPFIPNMHMALWVLTVVSLLGAGVSPDASQPHRRDVSVESGRRR